MIDRSMREAVKQSEAEKLRELYELKKKRGQAKGSNFHSKNHCGSG